MGHRKQPFGYCMEMGKIVVCTQEAETVQYIFQQYLLGASFNDLVRSLTSRLIPYDQDKPWNKNMVARILADQRYIGLSDYPPIIAQSVMDTALRMRNAKKRPVQKTAAQKVIRLLSGGTATEETEHQVLDLLRGLSGRPERLYATQSQPASGLCLALEEKLNRIMNIQPLDEAAAKVAIFELADARYTEIGSEEYETQRLKRIFSRAVPMDELSAELLRSTVTAIYVRGNGTVRIELKNHQMIGDAPL